jgi:hypothetical protein
LGGPFPIKRDLGLPNSLARADKVRADRN